MDDLKLGELDVQIRVGDITDQPDLDAITNAANAQLQTGGGVAGAIHRAAGPGLAEECAPLAPIEPGACVITSGHGLPNLRVLHCLGPVHGRDEPAAELLASCYREALRLADDDEIGSVGFPAISTGAFGYPIDAATEVALETVAAAAPELRHVRLVRFVLFAASDREVYRQAAERFTHG